MPLTSMLPFWVGMVCTAAAGMEHSIAGKQAGLLSRPEIRQSRRENLAFQSRLQKEKAWRIAAGQGWRQRDILQGTVFELMAVERDWLIVYKTCNTNAAISIAVNLIRNTTPYKKRG